MQETCPLPVYFGFDYLPDLLKRREAGEPFVFMDHAYFDRGYENANFRVLLNSIHRTNTLDGLSVDRKPKGEKEWHQGDKVFVIPVPPNIAEWHDAHRWTTETIERLRQHTNREIVVKPKNGPPMRDLLRQAWAVVSHSSVAAVEAAYLGVPVFGPKTSPAYPVGLADLSKIEEPIKPDRDKWLRTLSYSQFSFNEIRNGKAWAVLKGQL